MNQFTSARNKRRAINKSMAVGTGAFVEIPPHEWPDQVDHAGRIRVLRNRDYLVQVFEASGPAVARLSVNRCLLCADGRWRDGISWDDLQEIKSKCGYWGMDAVEVYPRDMDVVNVANIRHLWIMRDPVPFAWRAEGATA